VLFPTIDFGIFFIIVFFVSWSLRGHHTLYKCFLILASYFFYGFWDWHFTFLLFGYSVANYFFALFIDRVNTAYRLKNPAWENGKLKKAPLAVVIFVFAMVCNLGVLAFFKYFYFLTTNFNNIFIFLGIPLRIPMINIILPIGISFFTFQAMSYTIDVFKGAYRANKSFIDVLLFKAFFPQLVAGPIVRAGEFLPQLKSAPVFENIEVGRAIALIGFGLFKKVFIANYLGTMFVDPVFENPLGFGGAELLFGVYAYAVQIFCDFSAYSEIAIGTALLLGYRFPDNFNNPYRAVSIQDFWRRWHISLSSWLRDYLYISLGGNRKGKAATYRNLIITMLLGGLWHGAAWNFIIWGGLHGGGLAVERFISERRKKENGEKKKRFIFKILGVIFTFHFVCLGWIFFRSPNLSMAIQYLAGIFSPTDGFKQLTPFLLSLIVLGLLIHFIPRSWGEKMQRLIERLPVPAMVAGFGAFLLVLSAVSPAGVAPFIYFQF
jgi:D-alanyl-lipoteichoic acid acyltransferase DltB (MBOAT superfamily)